MDERALEAAARAAYDHNNPHMVGKQTEAWRMYIPSMRAAIAAYLEASGEARYREHVQGCVDAAFAEGLNDRLAEQPTEPGNLRDLVERRLLHVQYSPTIDTAMQEGK